MGRIIMHSPKAAQLYKQAIVNYDHNDPGEYFGHRVRELGSALAAHT